MMICPPLTNAVFPAAIDSFDGRPDHMPIRVRMAWGGVKSPVEDRRDVRSNGGGVDRPRPAPSPEVPARHRPAKVARPARCVRSTDSTFYSPRTKLIFLKDVSAVHYRPGCTKPRFLSLRLFIYVHIQKTRSRPTRNHHSPLTNDNRPSKYTAHYITLQNTGLA